MLNHCNSRNSWRFLFKRDISLHTNTLDRVIESFYLETLEGLFFAVKGLEHPPDRLISIVRYAPDPGGQREKKGIRYRRLYHFDEQEELLRSFYPQYLAKDSIFQATLQSVPISRIRVVHDPRVRLKEMSENPPTEGIEADAAAFAGLIVKEAVIPWSGIGVTGSLLIGLQGRSSDLDISIFGSDSCRKVYRALESLRERESAVRRLDRREIDELYRQRAIDTATPFEVFARLESKKVCQGCFRGRPYFIRFIKEAHEVAEKYGTVQYTALGRTTLTATVVDSRDAIFTPCRYGIADLHVVEGPPVQIAEVVSFRGRFCEQAQTGEVIRASGTIEKVRDVSGKVRYRLLLGNSPQDFLWTAGNDY